MTLAVCGSGTSDTTTTEDTRGWSVEAFRDVMAYCQATDEIGSCAQIVTSFRDHGKCSVEATYKVVDHMIAKIDTNDKRQEALNDFIRDQLQPAGDCLGIRIVLDE